MGLAWKLLVTSATLVVTSALLVVTMFAIRNKCLTTSNNCPQVNGLTVKSASHEVDISKCGDATWPILV